MGTTRHVYRAAFAPHAEQPTWEVWPYQATLGAGGEVLEVRERDAAMGTVGRDAVGPAHDADLEEVADALEAVGWEQEDAEIAEALDAALPGSDREPGLWVQPRIPLSRQIRDHIQWALAGAPGGMVGAQHIADDTEHGSLSISVADADGDEVESYTIDLAAGETIHDAAAEAGLVLTPDPDDVAHEMGPTYRVHFES